MVFLIDANVILRFLIGDDEANFHKSIEIFQKIEEGKIMAEVLPSVMMEVYFVLTKFYKIDKKMAIEDLKKILLLKGIIGEKILLYETLNLLEKKSIDFVDAYLCIKAKMEGYGIISFDKDLQKC